MARTALLGAIVFLLGCQSAQQPAVDWMKADWPAVEAAAKGTTVRMMMWQGDPLINRYMQTYVVPSLLNQYGITLEIAPGQGTEIVKNLMAEKEAGRSKSHLDVCWINGETFFQLRQISALYGPFTEKLPNAQYIDFENPFIGIDFQQKIAGFECPWGNVQMTMIYDSIRTPHPPQSLGDWEAFWQQHPGRFTIPYEFTGMTLLKSWMVALAGDPQYFKGSFDEVKYKRVSDQLWAFINRNKANFWRKGETFPESLAAVHQMFANKELDFTMSNNDAEVDNKIIQGVFPGTALAYVPAYGSIRNSHYLGIPGGAQNLPGALVAINFLCSPAAQWEKMKPDVWGDGTILAIDGLPAPWPDRFTAIPGRKNAPARNTLDAKALQEPAPEYMIRLYNDFRTRVIDNNR